MNDSVHLVCPHCGGVNRVATQRLADHPKCGKCKQNLFEGKPHAADAEAFVRQRDKSDLPVLVDFWASWCGPCQMMAPAFKAAAVKLEPRVRLLKVDTEANQALSASLGIRSIPTLALFQRGKELARQAGAMDQNGIIAWTKQYVR